jgi:hypothetical protein
VTSGPLFLQSSKYASFQENHQKELRSAENSLSEAFFKQNEATSQQMPSDSFNALK